MNAIPVSLTARVSPERASGLLGGDELAPRLDSGRDQLDRLRPGERQVVEARPASTGAHKRGQLAQG
jgi:hypothetical protein